MLDVVVVNTWTAYQTANKQKRVSFFEVRRKTVLAYLNRKSEPTPKCQVLEVASCLVTE
jgi:hypothetical protein